MHMRKSNFSNNTAVMFEELSTIASFYCYFTSNDKFVTLYR